MAADITQCSITEMIFESEQYVIDIYTHVEYEYYQWMMKWSCYFIVGFIIQKYFSCNS